MYCISKMDTSFGRFSNFAERAPKPEHFIPLDLNLAISAHVAYAQSGHI